MGFALGKSLITGNLEESAIIFNNMIVNIYLNFDGNCEEAFNYYKSVFGGEFESISKFSDMPDNPECPVPDDDKDKTMHVTLPIGGGTVIMGSDTSSAFGPPHSAGNNFSISVDADSRDDADRIFGSLSDGGQVTMPMQDTFWESYFGSCTDKFGINWMVSHSEASKS